MCAKGDLRSITTLLLFSHQVARARELTAWAREALRQAEADDERKDEVQYKVLNPLMITLFFLDRGELEETDGRGDGVHL